MTASPLVLLPPAGGNARAFEPLVEALAVSLPGRRCEVLEYPGRRPGGRALSTVSDLAGFVEGKLGSRGLEDAVLFGHSLGGAVALEIALRGAVSLDALVLCSTGGRLRVHPMIMEMVRQAARDGQPLPLPAVAFGPEASERLVERVARVWAETHPAGALGDWEAVAAFDRLASLGQVELPTLVLSGEQDGLTPPRYAERLAADLADAELRLHPSAGHLLPWEDPGWVARTVGEFLS